MKRTLKKLAALLLALIITLSFSVIAFADDSNSLKYDYVTELPDGGKIYTYIIDGMANDFPVPPEGFNPLTASDETLEAYGFPPRPTDEEELAKWEMNMACYKRTPIPEVEVTNIVHKPFNSTKNAIKDNRIFNSISPLAVVKDKEESKNWSGYVAVGGTNKYAQVQGDFVQPAIQSGCKSGTAESTWIGLGGYYLNADLEGCLLQAGTAMNTFDGAKNYYAWYEIIGIGDMRPEVKFKNITVRPGDSIHCFVSFQRANNKFNAYIANNTNGTSQSVVVSNLNASKYYDGRSAEFINERPSNILGLPFSLTKYGTANWFNCQTYLSATSSWATLGSQSVHRVTMKVGTKELAVPSGLSGKTFKSTWNAYS